MGYSARYHAASLAAVFLALAVGILIGAGLGDNLLSDTEDNLRESLQGDIEEARGEADELQVQLDRERAFGSSAYPALVSDTLAGQRIGLLALGDLPGDLSADIQEALEPTGGELVEVAVVRRPPDREALATTFSPGRFAKVDEDDGQLEELGDLLGSQFALGGGKQLDKSREILFSRSSGEGGRLDGVILARAVPGELEPEDAAAIESLESGLITGVTGTGAPTVAAERSDDEESSVGYFGPFDVATVDSVDLTSGQAALVFALLGAEGNFGIKGTANALLPELLKPSR